MGYFRAHHKKRGKMEKSQIAHAKEFFQVHGYPLEDKVKAILNEKKDLFMNWDKGKCCDTDSCNDGKGNCNGSCNHG